VRTTALHRWLLPLAFLAMLLVVVAPLISRALAHPPVPAATPHAMHHMMEQPMGHAMAHDMHHGTHHDMVMDEPAAMEDAAPTTAADPHAGHDMGVDCEYCLLAARMISLLVALLLFMALWPRVFRALAGLVDTRRVPAPGTLGARGPPSGFPC